MPDAQTSYKQQKEDFVSNLSGGTVAEINYVTAVVPVAIVLWSVLQTRQAFFKDYSLLSLAVDYLLTVGAFLLSITTYADQPVLLSLLLLAPAVLIYVLPPAAAPPRKKKPKAPVAAAAAGMGAAPVQPEALPMKPFLTTYRGVMMVTTFLAILAVDFRVFPRRFAKVETWGTSLMDLGVGSFVFSAGVVAARPVLKEKMLGRAAGGSGAATPLARRVLRSLRHSVPLLALGVVRLLSVKGLDYAEHITEYGVHWNFFFTLGVMPMFVAAFQSALAVIPSYAALSLLVAGVYQVVLETTDLKAYILTAPRTDLLSMNREGVFSFLGYLAIFLAGQDLGMFVMPRKINPRSNASPGMQRNTLIMTMAVWAGVWAGLYFLVTDYRYGFGLGVSRRMANLPYVLWIVTFNHAQLLAFCAIDSFFFPAFYNANDARTEREAYEVATSPVLRAMNRNGLALFLAANLLTGLVNMTVNTLAVGPAAAVGVLLAYSATVTAVALVLDRFDITIRL
jgi:phosphatidylinositol glycan class W